MAKQNKWYISEVIATVEQHNIEALRLASRELVADIKSSMKPGNYRVYRSKKGDGTIHWSAAPFLPPAPDTRKLINSIRFVFASEWNETISIIGTDDPVGKFMELGTFKLASKRSGGALGRVLPRFWLRVALERNKQNILKAFTRVKLESFAKGKIKSKTTLI